MMKPKIFLNNLVRLLLFSLVPIMLLSGIYLLVSIPEQRTETNAQTHNHLTLLQENLTVLLNDTSKVMTMMENTANFTTLRKVLRTREMGYGDYLSYKNLLVQISAVINYRSYIDSIYVYVPNEQGAYLSNQGRLFLDYDTADANWLEQCRSDAPFHIVHRSVERTGGAVSEYISLIERNENNCIVVVNIKQSYFKRIFASLKLKEQQVLMIAKGDTLLSASAPEADTLFESLELNDMENEDAFVQQGYLIVRSQSAALGVDVISAMPTETVYAANNRFVFLLLVVTLLCMVFSVATALLNASRTSKRLYQIVDLMDAATNNRPMPVVNPSKHDIYGFILTNMIQTFVQNDFLKVLLDERKFQAISLELSALQYQINPHFLSNTLQIIDFEVVRACGGHGKASRMIEQLSDFLQYSLKAPDLDVTVEKEKEATELYVSLMQARFADKFTVSWRVDDQALGIAVPKLMLQPIIENNVQHGLNDERMLHVDISIRAVNKHFLEINVKDDGVGTTAEQLVQIRNGLDSFKDFSEHHIGLANLYRRLKLRFGNEAELRIESGSGKGFSVTLRIPMM